MPRQKDKRRTVQGSGQRDGALPAARKPGMATPRGALGGPADVGAIAENVRALLWRWDDAVDHADEVAENVENAKRAAQGKEITAWLREWLEAYRPVGP